MKKLIVALLLLSLFLMPAAARDRYAKDLGVGLYLGSPVGVTAKYELDNDLAVTAGLGLANGLAIFAGVQYNFVDFSIENLNFNVYVNGNAAVNFGNFDIGIDIPLGISYYFKDPAIEVFLEVGPSLRFVSGNAGAVGGIGGRYQLDL